MRESQAAKPRASIATPSGTTRTGTRRQPRRHAGKHPRRHKQRPWWRRVPVWGYAAGIAAALAIYVVLLNKFIVAPFSLPWQGIFGEHRSPEGFEVRGIDISHHQGTIDWDALPAADVDGQPLSFVFMKATEGTDLVDEHYAANLRQAHEHGLVCGAYHFFNPDSDARRQAQHFIRHAGLLAGDLPPVLDVEKRGHLSEGELQAAVITWLRIVEQYYGAPPILYTGASFKHRHLNDARFTPYPYWIAHYYVQRPSYDGTWAFWQYTDVGNMAGIRGHVDLDIFNGTPAELQELTLKE